MTGRNFCPLYREEGNIGKTSSFCLMLLSALVRLVCLIFQFEYKLNKRFFVLLPNYSIWSVLPDHPHSVGLVVGTV